MRHRACAFWAACLLLTTAAGCSLPLELTLPALRATPTPTLVRAETVAAPLTQAPRPSATPTSTPTPTATPTATPTSTPSLLERLSAADQAMAGGDYEAAAQGYDVVGASSPALAEQAQLGLGAAYLRDGQFDSAIEVLESYLTESPQDDGASTAEFLLAEALMAAGDPLAASERYQAYLSAGTVITAYVNEARGVALWAAGDPAAAVKAYEAAIPDAPDRSFLVGVREKLALAHVGLGDYAAAVAQYDAILDVARINAYRARIEHQAAETLILAGAVEAGYERHLKVVEGYATEAAAYLSLVELVEAGRPPDDFLRGFVDYYGEAYEAAVAVFDRYVGTNPETHSGDAHWYAGLSHLALGDTGRAASEFLLLIETHPENDHQGDGWMGLADAYAAAGDLELAVATYEAFVEAMPAHRRAPEALWEAARQLEYEGDLVAASEAYMACHTGYPDSEYGDIALFRSGLLSYRLGDLTAAALGWDTLAALYTDSLYRPMALLWSGKIRLEQDDPESARAALEQASVLGAGGYYGLRSIEVLADPLAEPYVPGGQYEPTADPSADQAAAEQWLADWLALDSDDALGELGPALAADSRLQRGLELWRLGRLQEAKWEFEAIREATRADALAQYQLALLFRDIGLYRSSILCAVRLISLSPAVGVPDAPVFLGRLAYPDHYHELVVESADEFGLDPLIVFAQIRQESLFESLATSVASAHGLMQVIPPTGRQIASELGWPAEYDTGDLYLPYVSVRFGAYYLARQRDRFDGRLDVALAAYNGGPGNAQRWLELAGRDSDLFLELITFRETRLYLQRIKEQFAVYQALYLPP